MSYDLLIDCESNTYVDNYHVGSRPDDSQSWSVSKRTLRGGPSDGVDVVTVDNGRFQFDVLPTRGMGLWRGQCDGVRLGWDSPAKFPVHPSRVESTSWGGFGWLAGFNEWCCRCGLASIGNPEDDQASLGGMPELTLHGRVANLSAHRLAVEISEDQHPRIAIHGTVDEAVLFGSKLRLESTVQTDLGSGAIEIRDRTINLGDQSCEFQLMYHINFGPPLLQEGSKIHASASDVTPYDEHSSTGMSQWSVMQSPEPGRAEECYFITPQPDGDGNVRVVLRNAVGDSAVSVDYPASQLPWLTVWKHLAGIGDGYVVGIEPGVSFPNRRSVERAAGRLPTLDPHQTYDTTVRIACHHGAEEVAAVLEGVA